MALFWRKGSSEAAREALRLARERHPSTHASDPPADPIRGLGPRRPTFNGRDWAQIDELLAEGSEANCARFAPDESVRELMHALDELRSFVRYERMAGATHVRNCLLDVWSIANQIDPQISRPAEVLLTGLVSRDLVSADEIHELCDRTERAATGRRIRHTAS